jgi:hypothetical protein
MAKGATRRFPMAGQARAGSVARVAACGVILRELKRLKPQYAREGFVMCGIFGSYARPDFDEHSDIDIAYRLARERFFACESRSEQDDDERANRSWKEIACLR